MYALNTEKDEIDRRILIWLSDVNLATKFSHSSYSVSDEIEWVVELTRIESSIFFTHGIGDSDKTFRLNGWMATYLTVRNHSTPEMISMIRQVTQMNEPI